ncbi:hypothetical protein KCV07_g3779, partial [Aureobasidium melanogenum]
MADHDNDKSTDQKIAELERQIAVLKQSSVVSSTTKRKADQDPDTAQHANKQQKSDNYLSPTTLILGQPVGYGTTSGSITSCTICKYCKKDQMTEYHLKRHWKKCVGSFCCDLCDFKTKQMSHLRRHIEDVHKRMPRRRNKKIDNDSQGDDDDGDDEAAPLPLHRRPRKLPWLVPTIPSSGVSNVNHDSPQAQIKREPLSSTSDRSRTLPWQTTKTIEATTKPQTKIRLGLRVKPHPQDDTRPPQALGSAKVITGLRESLLTRAPPRPAAKHTEVQVKLEPSEDPQPRQSQNEALDHFTGPLETIVQHENTCSSEPKLTIKQEVVDGSSLGPMIVSDQREPGPSKEVMQEQVKIKVEAEEETGGNGDLTDNHESKVLGKKAQEQIKVMVEAREEVGGGDQSEHHGSPIVIDRHELKAPGRVVQKNTKVNSEAEEDSDGDNGSRYQGTGIVSDYQELRVHGEIEEEPVEEDSEYELSDDDSWRVDNVRYGSDDEE